MREPTEDEFWDRFAQDAPALEAELEREFGTPAEVIAKEEARLRQQAQDALTGMPEEQAEWDGDDGAPIGLDEDGRTPQACGLVHPPTPWCGPGPHQDEGRVRPYPASKLEWS